METQTLQMESTQPSSRTRLKFFRLTQTLLKSWHSLKGSAQDGSQHLIFGGGRIWMTELNPQTGVLVIAKFFLLVKKCLERDTEGRIKIRKCWILNNTSYDPTMIIIANTPKSS